MNWLVRFMKRDPSFICDPRIAGEIIRIRGHNDDYNKIIKSLTVAKPGRGRPRIASDDQKDRVYLWIELSTHPNRTAEGHLRKKNYKWMPKVAQGVLFNYHLERRKHYELRFDKKRLDQIVKECAKRA